MAVIFCDSNIFIDALPQNDEGRTLEKLRVDSYHKHVLLESVEKEVERVIQKFRQKTIKMILYLAKIDDFTKFQIELNSLLKNKGTSPLERVQQKYGSRELFDRRTELFDIYSEEIDEIEKKFYFFTNGVRKYPFNRGEIEEKRKWIHSHYGKVFGRRKGDETHICGVLSYDAEKKIFITNDNFFHYKIKKIKANFINDLKNQGIEIYNPTRFFNAYYLHGYE